MYRYVLIKNRWTYIHGGVNLCNSFVLCGELIDLHSIADKLAHDLDLQLVQLALGYCVGLSDDGDDVNLI